MSIIDRIKGGIIVSCQALADEPLHSSFIMGRMAQAAQMGGASGIRANGYQDIVEVRKNTRLPVIGIVKREYKDSNVYITPTSREIDEVSASGAEIIAIDATLRRRPGGLQLKDLYNYIRTSYPRLKIMADISTYEEAMAASDLGFDLIATTLSGYTDYTRHRDRPDFDLMDLLVKSCKRPIIAEGNIGTPEEARRALDLGVTAVVVGAAITRPQLITKKFVDIIEK